MKYITLIKDGKYGTTCLVAMTYEGSKIDYSKIDEYKHATVCKSMKDLDGDTTVIAAAKKAQISNIMHVDTSVETSKFLVFIPDMKRCVTVYGQ